jgi:hypothetical protein
VRPSVSGSRNGGTIFARCRTAKVIHLPYQGPSRSPIAASTTCFTGVRSITSDKVLPKFSRTTIAVAPESFSWCSSSRGVYSGLTLTHVYPARSTAAMVTANCGMFGSMMATRAPGSSPRDCNHAPSAREWSSSSR